MQRCGGIASGSSIDILGLHYSDSSCQIDFFLLSVAYHYYLVECCGTLVQYNVILSGMGYGKFFRLVADIRHLNVRVFSYSFDRESTVDVGCHCYGGAFDLDGSPD